MKDTLDHGYRNFRETIALKWGRHFRINDKFKVIIGRDEEENISLVRYAYKDDHIMHLEDTVGGTLLLKGENPDEETLATAAGLIQRFTKARDNEPQKARYWKHNDRNNVKFITAKKLPEEQIKKIQV